jgi:RNA polymerase sigma-70 factor (ECF subfamily)
MTLRPHPALDHLDDTALMAHVARRDPHAEVALAALHRRHAAAIGRAVERRFGRERTEDVVQESFLRAWRHAARFDPEHGSAAAWLQTIALRTAVDLFRSSRRSVVATERLDAAPDAWSRRCHRASAAASSHDHETEWRLVLDDALAELSVEHRAVLDHAYRGDLTQQQIANQLGLPLGTVKTRTFHALASMRRRVLPALAA